jgi:hypothetical protein
MRKLFITLIAAFGITAYATAQDVTGTIRTTAGAPIAGVVVTDEILVLECCAKLW